MGQGDRFLVPVIQLITFDEMGHCTRPRVPFLLNMARVDEIDVCVSFLLNLFGETC
jgi:hypothetical protein